MVTASPPFNIAHRGARSLAPENTMPAFVKALEYGAHGIESDVRVSADGRLILHHDSTFERTTDVARVFPKRKAHPVHAFDWSEIARLDAGSWFGERDPFATIAGGDVSTHEAAAYCGTPIPLLEEALVFAREHELFFNIEIKPLPEAMASFDVAARLIESIEKTGLGTDLFSISSFHHPYLRRVKELRPDIEVNALIGENLTAPQDWGNYEFPVYNANVDLIDILQLEEAWHHGCRVNLYTVNHFAQMRHYLELGVEKIITDFPQLLSGNAPAADDGHDRPRSFQPFADRLSRDIRNKLSKAFALSLAAGTPEAVYTIANTYLAGNPALCYRDYIHDRLKRYRRILSRLQASSSTDTLRLAVLLWDERLFFEVHEILEPLWLQAEGDSKLFLQAMIRAAGCYVKLEAGYPVPAAGIAAKALPVLAANRHLLDRHAATDRLLEALTPPLSPPPLLGSR